MKSLLLAALLMAVCAGCATTDSVGSRQWYDLRLQEAQGAYESGELSVDEFLALKLEIDQTRLAYQNALRNRAYYEHRRYPSPFFYPYPYRYHRY